MLCSTTKCVLGNITFSCYLNLIFYNQRINKDNKFVLSFLVAMTNGKRKVFHERGHTFPKIAFQNLVMRQKTLKNVLVTKFSHIPVLLITQVYKEIFL